MTLRLEGTDTARVHVDLRLRQGVLGSVEVEVLEGGRRTVAVSLSPLARNRLRRAAGRHLVAIAVATDVGGRRAKARTRVRVR
jgi:hypothetical protein